jgi:AraC-like DNA-binding protein
MEKQESAFGVREAKLLGDDLDFPGLAYVTSTTDFLSSRVAWHAHEFWEVLMFFRGGAHYELEGGERREVPGNHFLIVPPGRRHRGDKDIRLPCDFCGIGFFGGGGLEEGNGMHSPLSGGESDWILGRLGSGSGEVFAMDPSLLAQADNLRRAVLLYRALPLAQGIRSMLRHAVALVLVEVAEGLGRGAREAGSAPIASAMELLEAKLAQSVGMDSVAQAVGLTRKQFYARFRSETGMTPNDWLQRQRLRRAEQLLIGTDWSVEVIGREVGFQTAPYFCRVFRKYLGRSPGQFREESALR